MEVDQKISANLRLIRKERGLTLDKLSELTGVSKAMLSQIERGVSSPTVSLLWQISSGLNVSFSNFIASKSENDNYTNILRTGSEKKISGNVVDDNLYINVLFPFESSVNFEVYELGLKEDYEHKSSAHNNGVIEHIICVKGKMAIYCDKSWHILSEGESFRFSGAQSHSYKNIGSGKLVFYDIIHYPDNYT
jgi:transcriptional regulator with XRE-family HTH domain